MSNTTFAATLADIFERQKADTITESEASAEIKTALDTWAGLSTTNPQLVARVVDFLARVEGLIILTNAPVASDGAVGALAFAVSERAFYGPKTASGWGSPSVVLDGTDASITIGAVQAVDTGEPAAVRNVGTPLNAEFEFDLPRGATGVQGPSGTLAVGAVSTGAAGSAVSITNSGTPQAAVLNITIPKGDKGDTGDAATLAIGTITILPADGTASATNSGTSGAAVLDLEIPRGQTGFVLNSFRGAWDNATGYNEGDLVEREGSTYIANEGVSNLVGAVPSLASPSWSLFSQRGAAADVVGETLVTADATLTEAAFPLGKLVRVKAAGASGGAVNLTIPDDRPQGWRYTFVVSDGQLRFAFGNNTLTIDGDAVDLAADTPVVNAGARVTLLADTIGNIVRI